MKVVTLTLAGLRFASTAMAREGGDISAPPAGPKTVKGDKAKSFILAMKLAKIAPIKAKNKWTYKASALWCHALATDTEDNLPMYDCTIDKRKVADAAALTLMDAMSGVGLQVDQHMEQETVEANTVVCTNDQTASGDNRYQCTFTAGAAAEPAAKK